jgi:hypothetical protein
MVKIGLMATEGEIMKERVGILKRLRSRIKGLVAIGLAAAMAFGMMPSVQVKAQEIPVYEGYGFVQSGDKAILVADVGGSGGLYYCTKGVAFSGNSVLNADLSFTEKGEEDFDFIADQDAMKKTITIKFGDNPSGYDSLYGIEYGFVGNSGNIAVCVDGEKKEDIPFADDINDTIHQYYYGGTIVEEGEYDLTLNTESAEWIIDIVNPTNTKSVTFDKTELNFKQGDTAQKLAISPKLNLNRFDWTSSDANVATVDATGTVTPEKGGTATITATLKSNTSIKATCTVNVEGKEATVDRSADTMETGLKITQNKKGLKVKWDAEADAAKYEVYAAYLGKKNPDKIEATKNSAQIKTIGGKAINTKKNYEIYVVAYDSKGNKIGTSLKAFVAGKDSKNTNAKKITANKKVSLKAGKTVKVKANVKLADSKKKALAKKYASDVRYLSTDTGVATVSKSGKIKGVAPGTCTVLAIAKNGLAAKIKVTVK